MMSGAVRNSLRGLIVCHSFGISDQQKQGGLYGSRICMDWMEGGKGWHDIYCGREP